MCVCVCVREREREIFSNVIYSCDHNCIFSIITPVFSVTRACINHCHMLICYSINIYSYIFLINFQLFIIYLFQVFVIYVKNKSINILQNVYFFVPQKIESLTSLQQHTNTSEEAK